MAGWGNLGDTGLTAAVLEEPAVAPSGSHANSLIFTGRTWPLFGRTLLVALAQYEVVPSPWANTAFYRWFVHRIVLPNGKAVGFAGKPGDIWWAFMLLALSAYANAIHDLLVLAVLPLTVWLYIVIMRWVFANLIWAGRAAPLRFTGGYWGLLGWMALSIVSILTIIGWAWAMNAMMRWICRHVEGSSQRLDFVATGWNTLWRTFAFSFLCILIIPIPWLLRWYTRWMVAQFVLVPRAGTAVAA